MGKVIRIEFRMEAPEQHLSINKSEREKRKKAADYARASVGLEGFKLSKEAEERIKRFIEGDINLQELIGERNKILIKSGRVDGRSLRRSTKTSRINIAVKPEIEQDLWEIAEKLTPHGQKLLPLGDVLEAVINAYKAGSEK